MEDWLAFLGHRWSALVLWHLKDGRWRHGELAARLPRVSPKVLAERLEALAARGLVRREEAGGFPRAVTYALAPAGAELTAVLNALTSRLEMECTAPRGILTSGVWTLASRLPGAPPARQLGTA